VRGRGDTPRDGLSSSLGIPAEPRAVAETPTDTWRGVQPPGMGAHLGDRFMPWRWVHPRRWVQPLEMGAPWVMGAPQEMGAAPGDGCTLGDGRTPGDGCSPPGKCTSGTLRDRHSPQSWVQPPKTDVPPGDGCSHTANCQGPGKDFPREFWREGWGHPAACPCPPLRCCPTEPGPPPQPASLAGAAASPGEVDTLLGELAGAVDGVLVGLVLHHLHALALLTLLVTVLADGVELPHAVLQPQRPASALPSPAPAPSRHRAGTGSSLPG